MLLYLIPQVVCLLGLLLWATPNVHSELEGRTWIYLAVRPDGKAMVLLGKYLTAVAWSASACLLALTISVIVCSAFQRLDNPLRLSPCQTRAWLYFTQPPELAAVPTTTDRRPANLETP
jgi:ABC-type transport system involved in multi-copper enzyme maturation permease subunit